MEFKKDFVEKLNSKSQEIFYDNETFRYNSKNEIGITFLQLSIYLAAGIFLLIDIFKKIAPMIGSLDMTQIFLYLFTHKKFMIILVSLSFIYSIYKILLMCLYKVSIDFSAKKVLYKKFLSREINFDDIERCTLENEQRNYKDRNTPPHFYILTRDSKTIKIYLWMNLEKKCRLILMMKQCLGNKFHIDESFYN
ncbi:MAG: hypothetical protein ACRCSK_05385 [Fusobacteriaceae bacterium]